MNRPRIKRNSTRISRKKSKRWPSSEEEEKFRVKGLAVEVKKRNIVSKKKHDGKSVRC